MLKLHDPLRDAQQDAPAWTCSQCGGEVWSGEPFAVEDGQQMCVDCFRRRVESLLKNSPAIVAACLGIRYEEGEDG